MGLGNPGYFHNRVGIWIFWKIYARYFLSLWFKLFPFDHICNNKLYRCVRYACISICKYDCVIYHLWRLDGGIWSDQHNHGCCYGGIYKNSFRRSAGCCNFQWSDWFYHRKRGSKHYLDRRRINPSDEEKRISLGVCSSM